MNKIPEEWASAAVCSKSIAKGSSYGSYLIQKGEINLKYTVKDVLQFVEENDVKFIRLVFFDIFGVMKNISIMSQELKRAFERGVQIIPSSIDGFEGTGSDLMLFPDPGTLKILPWRPQHDRVARLLCDIRKPDGTPFEGNVRNVLKKAADVAESMGFKTKAGLSCEFYLFRLDENGEPTRIPCDKAGYLDIAPLDKGENIRRQICLTLEEMEINPLSSHHESGPGQNQIDFRHSDLLTCADDFVTFKTVVKTAAQANGLYASFLPKPLADNSGSGMHINLSLKKNGQNIFQENGKGMTESARHFIAGVLRHAAEMTVFFDPLPNSYLRFGSFKAPDTIDWSYHDLNPLVRVPDVRTDRARMDFRSPDPSCNPYLAFSMLLYAGLDGIENRYELQPESSYSSNPDFLPQSLQQACELARKSSFVKSCLPETIYQNYLDIISDTVSRSLQGGEFTRQSEERYFEII